MATEEIEISELEFTEELASDNLIPVESSTDTKATSLQILKNWLSSFFVGKTGDEHIYGGKIFSHTIYQENPYISFSTIPSANQFVQHWAIDKDGVALGCFEYRQLADGSSGTSIVLRKKGSGSTIVWERLGIFQDINGNFYATAPTPAASDNSNKIVTTTWTRNNVLGFYNWGSLVNAGAYDAIYTAPSNGLLGICRTSAADWNNYAYIYSGTTTSTTVVGAIASAYQYSNGGSATIPVKKGEQHYVRAPNGSYLFFVPQA